LTANQTRYAAPAYFTTEKARTEELITAESPNAVATTIAAVVSARFAGVHDEQWDRTGLRSDGSEFTVLTLGQYFLHDLAHHLVDVRA
jgi:hypothetical protein